jgi:uracil-DNA glycosylase family 4
MSDGLFRSEAHGRQKKRKRNKVSSETLKKLGLKGVKRMNPRATSPDLQPSGPSSPDVYVLGWAPGFRDDEHGEPFTLNSSSAATLRKAIPRRQREDVRFGYVCRTYPPAGRDPKAWEIECFAPSVIADIEASNPRAIVTVGRAAAAWATRLTPIKEHLSRGKRFRAKIGSWTGWVYTVMDHDLAHRLKDGGRYEDIDGEEWFKTFRKDVRRAFDEHALDRPEIPDTSLVALRKPCTLRKERNARRVIEDLKELADEPVLTFDFETTHLRPYWEGARCLSIAVGTARRTLAFAFDHPATEYSAEEREAILAAFVDLLRGAERVTAHNLAFELEWLAHLTGGFDALDLTRWDDTMVQAYILGNPLGTLNLNYLTSQHIGVPVKELTGVDSKQAITVPLPKLLLYNALDVIYTDRLAAVLEDELELAGLTEVYEELGVRRVKSVVAAQRHGLPVDPERNARFSEEYEVLLGEIRERLFETAAVKRYNKTHARYNPDGQTDNIKLFRDVIGAPEGETDKGGYSTDREHLEAMQDPLAIETREPLLEYREISKLKGTYVDKFSREHKETLVYPDGRLHGSFNTCVAATGRLSSSGPNMQNFPKRKHKVIRQQLVAPPGMTILSADYGQIEHRAVAIVSNDRAMIRALIEGYDVHLKYAKRAAELEPEWFVARHDGNIKSCRSAIKNQFVFPTIYGAAPRSIAGYTGLRQETVDVLCDEFWAEHAGVRRWQKKVRQFYDRNGYVQSLLGRIRRGPLSHNMILNTPIQGLASDIVVNAMDRLFDIARERGEWWLAAALNIHDDLTFLIPDEHLDEAAGIIIEGMLDIPYDFINVPILVEAEVGRNWGEMSSIGEFNSYDLAA